MSYGQLGLDKPSSNISDAGRYQCFPIRALPNSILSLVAITENNHNNHRNNKQRRDITTLFFFLSLIFQVSIFGGSSSTIKYKQTRSWIFHRHREILGRPEFSKIPQKTGCLTSNMRTEYFKMLWQLIDFPTNSVPMDRSLNLRQRDRNYYLFRLRRMFSYRHPTTVVSTQKSVQVLSYSLHDKVNFI